MGFPGHQGTSVPGSRGQKDSKEHVSQVHVLKGACARILFNSTRETILTVLQLLGRSLGHLMHVLQSSPIDYVRNESLGLLLLITAGNADIQILCLT